MNFLRKTFHASIFVVAAAAAGYFAYASSAKLDGGTGKEETSEVRKAFSNELFNVGDAKSFAITWQNASSTMVKNAKGRWGVAEREYALADTAKVIKFLTNLSEMRCLKTLSGMDDGCLKELCLTNDKRPEDGIRVCVKDGKDDVLFDAVMGAGHMKVASEQVGNYEVGTYDGRYVRMLSGTAAGKVILVPGVFEDCEPAPDKWIEHLRLPKLDDALQMNVSGIADGKRTTLWRAVRTTDGFDVIWPHGMKVHQKFFSDMIKVLNSPFGVGVVRKEKNKDVTFTHVLQIVLKNGSVYELFFCIKDDRSFVRLDTSYTESATERLQGESNEEFASRKKHLASQAGVFNECFADRIFISSAAVAQMILKVGLPPETQLQGKAKNVFEMKNGKTK